MHRRGRDHRFLGHFDRRRGDGLAARRARLRARCCRIPCAMRPRCAVLRDFDPNARRSFVGDAIRAICKEAGPDVPVIGFAAAPWTLACYMIEGQTRGDISRAKQMLRERAADGAPAAGTHCPRDRAVSEIADCRGRRRDSTVRHVGGRTDAQRISTRSSCPRRKWCSNCSATPKCRRFYSPKARRICWKACRQSGADVISVDWRTDLAEARADIRPVPAQSGAAGKRGPEHPAWLGSRTCGEAAQSRRGKNRRPGPHPESRPRNPARDSRGKRQSLRRSRDNRARVASTRRAWPKRRTRESQTLK